MQSSKPLIFQNPQSDGSSFYLKGQLSVGILLFHGFTATTIEVRDFGEKLNNDGYSVLGKLLPGHGISPQELNRVHWQDWMQCAEEGLSELKKENQTVFIAGESMGALLSILLASNHPEIAGALLFAPALIIPGLWKASFVWPFQEYVYKKHVDLSSPWQGFNVVPLHAAMELSKLQRQTRKKLPGLNTPLIIFQGKKDQTVDAIGAVKILEIAGSEDKQMVWLDESSHCILMDKQFEEAYPIAKEFILTHTH